jgi:hypothetical protein
VAIGDWVVIGSRRERSFNNEIAILNYQTKLSMDWSLAAIVPELGDKLPDANYNREEGLSEDK